LEGFRYNWYEALMVVVVVVVCVRVMCPQVLSEFDQHCPWAQSAEYFF
jgi:hypothetical protein